MKSLFRSLKSPTLRQRLIRGVVEGFQETVFAYGQTGSGKTHTILGSERSSELGLLQLSSQELFATVASSQQRRVQLAPSLQRNDLDQNLHHNELTIYDQITK